MTMRPFGLTLTALPGVMIIQPVKHLDPRGFFSETYHKKALAEAGITLEFVQDNHSYSAEKGVVRGIHFQMPPFAQAKLVRVVRGSAFDVAVDLRKGSPTFGKHVSVRLSVEDWNQIFIPAGFGHGFCTLEPDTEIVYKVTDYYARECDRGIFWNDPELGIDWPILPDQAIISDKDRLLPRFRESSDLFE
jgi:dTDP-4-dehydrorhamnose 3,5-epimerase